MGINSGKMPFAQAWHMLVGQDACYNGYRVQVEKDAPASNKVTSYNPLRQIGTAPIPDAIPKPGACFSHGFNHQLPIANEWTGSLAFSAKHQNLPSPEFTYAGLTKWGK